MRDLGRKLLIGLGVAAAVTMAVGYAFIFGDIATPPGGDLGIVAVPDAGEALAVVLDDGRPAFAVADRAGRPRVFDAQVPGARSTLGALVAWCPETVSFSDPTSGAGFGADGDLVAGPGDSGLVAFGLRSTAVDKPAELIVGSDTESRPVSRNRSASIPPPGCSDEQWLVHRPGPGEVFDPSVAADQEPPGWIWLEGTLQVADDGVRLCDGLDGACSLSASVLGIDPASVSASGFRASGLFIGRMRDDAVEGLVAAPQFSEDS